MRSLILKSLTLAGGLAVLAMPLSGLAGGVHDADKSHGTGSAKAGSPFVAVLCDRVTGFSAEDQSSVV